MFMHSDRKKLCCLDTPWFGYMCTDHSVFAAQTAPFSNKCIGLYDLIIKTQKMIIKYTKIIKMLDRAGI